MIELRYTERNGYHRDIGPRGRSKRFYFGHDKAAATSRSVRVTEVWKCIERRFNGRLFPLHWEDATWEIAKAVARGEHVAKIKEETCCKSWLMEWPSYSREPNPVITAQYVRQLQRDFPFMRIELDDPSQLAAGDAIAEKLEKRAEEKARQTLERLRPSEAASTVNVTGQTVHEALNAWADAWSKKHVEPGSGGKTSPHGRKAHILLNALKRQHTDMPLEKLGLDECEAMLDVWPNRPRLADGTIAAPDTCRDAKKMIVNFLEWLHRSPVYRWRKPEDLDLRKPRPVKSMQGDRKAGRLATWSVAELAILYEYATPWERVVMLLGLNCGFAAAECASLWLSEILLDQPHPHPNVKQHGSWIIRDRGKTGVHGEWKLWPATVQAIRWQLAERGESPHPNLLLTGNGTPLNATTEGNNRKQTLAGAWTRLLTRVAKDKEYVGPVQPLSVKFLRKTGGNMIREIAGGEVMATYHARGKVVANDPHSDAYSDRPFQKVFDALVQVEEKLAPMFAAEANPFPSNGEKRPQPAIGRGMVKRICELRSQGHKLTWIAEQLGINKGTAARYAKGE
jgi:hypothetical protein